tara:strand:+ start:569 stop:1072 length:504 start_codon:yes stop_codon:yes gene_type:complete
VKKTAKREKKQIFFDVFASALLKRGKIWAPKIATKGHTGDQRTRRRPKDRTDTSRISLFFSLFFSLSLSFVSRMHLLFTVLLPGRKEDTESPVRRRRGESSLLRVSLLSLRSRDGGVVSSERERTKNASIIRPRKKNKQTKDARETKNLKKCHTWHFSARKERQRGF